MNNIFKRVQLIIFLLLAIYKIQAQDKTTASTSTYFEPYLIGKVYKAPTRGNGSVYLIDSWVKGNIILMSGDTVFRKLLKLDCSKNELVWMADGKNMVALDASLLKGFTLFPEVGISPRNFERAEIKFPLLSDTLVRYLEILGSGKVSAYAYHFIDTKVEAVTGSKGGLVPLSIYSPETLYFMRIDGFPVKQIYLSRRSIINAYPEYSDRIKQILRKLYFGGIRNEFQLKSAIDLINNNLQN